MFKVLDEACSPTRGTKYSACVDLYASEDVIIGAGETKIVGLGVAIEDIDGFAKNHLRSDYGLLGLETEAQAFIDNFKRTHYLQLNPRSSLRSKGLISNTGIVDLDYKDEIKIIIHNPVKKISMDMDKYITVGEYFEIMGTCSMQKQKKNVMVGLEAQTRMTFMTLKKMSKMGEIHNENLLCRWDNWFICK